MVYQETSYDYVLNFFLKINLVIVKKKTVNQQTLECFKLTKEKWHLKRLSCIISCRAVIYIDLKVLFYPVYTGTLVCKICFFIHRVLSGSVDFKKCDKCPQLIFKVTPLIYLLHLCVINTWKLINMLVWLNYHRISLLL